jgi:hypothetical protein
MIEIIAPAFRPGKIDKIQKALAEIIAACVLQQFWLMPIQSLLSFPAKGRHY